MGLLLGKNSSIRNEAKKRNGKEPKPFLKKGGPEAFRNGVFR